MSDFTAIQEYVVENISRPVKYIIYKLKELIRVTAKFISRTVPTNAASGYANIEKIEGNTVKWNQLLRTNIASYELLTVLANENKFIFNGTFDADSIVSWNINTYRYNTIAGHKYIILSLTHFTGSDTTFFVQIAKFSSTFWYTDYTGESRIITGTGNSIYPRINIKAGINMTGVVMQYQLIDLTAIFGAGNEPSTVAEFEAWMAQNIGSASYYDYNAGELISCKMESLKSIGFNQWDEEVEIGSISENNGRNVVSVNKLRSKNYIAIFEQDYYMKRPSRALERVFFYDANKNFLSWTYNASPIKPVSGAMYIRFTLTPGYGTTYNHDICINFFDPAKNGTYEAYQSDSANIDVTTITGVNTTTNVRETIFPNGMNWLTDSVHDEIDLVNGMATVMCGYYEISGGEAWEAVSTYPGVYRIPSRTPSNVANMSGDSIGKCSHYEMCPTRAGVSSILTNGQFGWNQSYYLHIKDDRYANVENFKAYLAAQYAAGTPVTIVYPITPITYTDLRDRYGNKLNGRYKVESGGTENILPQNTSTPISVAPIITTTYNKES